MPAKEAKPKNIIDSIMYSYSTSSNPHEEKTDSEGNNRQAEKRD